MPSANDFRGKFLDGYRAARGRHRDDEWKEIWADTSRWSQLMIYSETSVVRSVADELGLTCYPKEPLHFDAVFVKKTNPASDWFPFDVAIEHENNPTTFDGEIKKLLSVRCLLKVGVTYLLWNGRNDTDRLRTKIEKSITDLFSLARNSTSEDPNSEYLFLLGIERGDEPRTLRWFSIDFQAGEGPRMDQKFEPT